MSEFAVLQEAYEPIDPEVLAPILEKALGLVRYDAMHAAKESRGILAERIDVGRAEDLEVGLRAAGFEARRIPQDQVLRIGKPALVRTLAFTESALEIVQGYTSSAQAIPWGDIRFLSAGIVTEVLTKRITVTVKKKRRGMGLGGFLADMVAPGIGSMIFKMLAKSRDKKQASAFKSVATDVHLLDLFAGAPGQEMLHVRLKARDLYYDQILGVERVPSFLDNFLYVLGKLSSASPKAVVSPGLRALVESGEEAGKDPEEARFAHEHEFTQYNRWQMQMLGATS